MKVHHHHKSQLQMPGAGAGREQGANYRVKAVGQSQFRLPVLRAPSEVGDIPNPGAVRLLRDLEFSNMNAEHIMQRHDLHHTYVVLYGCPAI